MYIFTCGASMLGNNRPAVPTSTTQHLHIGAFALSFIATGIADMVNPENPDHKLTKS